MELMCGDSGCIFVKGHGGEHFTPTDGRDHSDEIRLRVLHDKCDRLREALEESLKLQCHYAKLLNMDDGGQRLAEFTVESWLARLEKIRNWCD